MKRSKGRPAISEQEKSARQALYPKWATDIKSGAQLSSKQLEIELKIGSRDGRTWRTWMAGTRYPTPTMFADITAEASSRGWLQDKSYQMHVLRVLARMGQQRDEREVAALESELQKIHAAEQMHHLLSPLRQFVMILSSNARDAGFEKSDFGRSAAQCLAKAIEADFMKPQEELRKEIGERALPALTSLFTRISNTYE